MSWIKYLSLHDISHGLNELEKQLTIEAEHLRKLTENLNGNNAVFHTRFGNLEGNIENIYHYQTPTSTEYCQHQCVRLGHSPTSTFLDPARKKGSSLLPIIYSQIMRDAPPQYSILFGALSALIPNTVIRYISLAAATASLRFYAAHHQRPSTRLCRLNTTIMAVTDILMRAKGACPRAHLALIEDERKLLQAELDASKIQTRLLQPEAPDESRILGRMFETWQTLNGVEKQLTIETERQRKLDENINETREIVNTATKWQSLFRPTGETYKWAISLN
ncbi:hypothetical protein DFH07DRAFT_774473 [Mycena maculata]|uniref:Uncharacterized protein n=1 Tax=Mycena maculata TaxID=230809 RepID=A0AAD7NA63_9AGAR|nr:hypothetical protein DFH07DRAFT_774473 [Mycena maculata]